ncbi:MAG: FAD-dependent oxidoreductase, partial [Oscillospiraceae bacterium]|nr:FAD-dependent oxidoreductase [Oscillospiraceae bacterium]
LPGVMTSDALLASPQAFKSLLIIGGGVIGVEMASVFSAFGASVTIIESLERILPAFDREISQNLAAILKKRGVSIITGALISEIKAADGALVCHYSKGDAKDSLLADKVLSATGREPAFSGLFDASLAIDTKRGIIVDSNFETSVKGIYAVGDVVEGGVQLAHAASAEGLCAVACMAGKRCVSDLTAIPACVYTDPEIASVGLTADDAERQGITVKTGKYLMSSNARSMIEGAERGFIKLVFREDNGTLIGAHLMCERATDLIAEATSAIARRMTPRELLSAVNAHPSFHEGFPEAVENADGFAIHIPPRNRA